MDLENAEEILQILERYTKQKSKTIPDELNGYLTHVALTGDSVYSWSKVQYFFREKLAYVLKEFHDTTPRTDDLPVSRNVDAFNYDTMKTALLERLDLFNAAPFTIQRLSELLNEPKKHYCRLDKYMRALEKNILVVSTVEPGRRQMGSENGDSINGDPLMDINVDVEMDKEPSSSCDPPPPPPPDQPSSMGDDALLSSVSDERSTEIKTEHGTTTTTTTTDDRYDEPPSISDEDAAVNNTNGHHLKDDLNDTIEDPKDDMVDSTDKAESSGDASIEPVAVEVQPDELVEKVNSPEPASVSSDAGQPIFESSIVIVDELPKEIFAEAVHGQVKSEVEPGSDAVPAMKAEDSEIKAEAKPENVSEGVKHSLDRDGDDEEEYQPTAAKLVKIDTDESVTTAESVPDAAQQTANNGDVPSDDRVADDQPSENVVETLSEAVLLEESSATETEEPKCVAIESPSPVVSVPTLDAANTPSETVDDDANNDSISTDPTISPLASTLSNDLDTLEEDELIESIIADAEPEAVAVAVAETDVEMTPSMDNAAEQMAVEDPAPVLTSTNSDSAMDAAQIIPSTGSDEQMDVIENNSMDQDL